MHRKKKRDPRRVAPAKSEHSLRFVDEHGKTTNALTTYVDDKIRAKFKQAEKDTGERV